MAARQDRRIPWLAEADHAVRRTLELVEPSIHVLLSVFILYYIILYYLLLYLYYIMSCCIPLNRYKL